MVKLKTMKRGRMTEAESFPTFFYYTSVGILYSYLYQIWCVNSSLGKNALLGREAEGALHVLFFYLSRRTKFTVPLKNDR